VSEGGEVDRDIVIAVLRANGVDVHRQDQGPADMLVIAKSGLIEAQQMPKVLSRKMVHYFSRKYGIPIHHFYNPEMGAQIKPS
jgi:hypothetical protein